jgi:polysaccharide biosynthesis transport protein
VFCKDGPISFPDGRSGLGGPQAGQPGLLSRDTRKSPTAPPGLRMTLRDYVRVVRQHELLILVATLLAGAAAVLLASRQEPRYDASAAVLLTTASVPATLTNTPNPNGIEQPDRVAATQARLARVPDVARRALKMARVADRTPDELLRASTVTADPASDFLTFTVGDARPNVAARLATAYAHAYARYRAATDVAPFLIAKRRLERRLADLRAAGRSGSQLYDELASRGQQLELLTAVHTGNAAVVREAKDATQTQPRPLRALAIGVPAGLLLGLVLALLSHVADTRARSLQEAEQVLGMPALGWIPRPPRRFRNRLVTLADPTSDYGEAFTALRTHVDLARRVHGGDVLLLTTIEHRTVGVKSTAIANLAVAFARAGMHVVLVDLDLRRPALSTLFGVEPRYGLIELLLRRADLDEALVPIPLQVQNDQRRRRKAGWHSSLEFGGTLRLLPVASRPLNASDVLANPGVATVMEQLQAEADLVLIDTPPLLEGSDAAALSVHVDSIALLVDLDRDSRTLLAEARRKLTATAASPLGFVGTGKTARTVVPPSAYDVVPYQLESAR